MVYLFIYIIMTRFSPRILVFILSLRGPRRRRRSATAAQHRHWICHWICTRFPGPCVPADLADIRVPGIVCPPWPSNCRCLQAAVCCLQAAVRCAPVSCCCACACDACHTGSRGPRSLLSVIPPSSIDLCSSSKSQPAAVANP